MVRGSANEGAAESVGCVKGTEDPIIMLYCHYIVPGGEADVDQARRGFEGVADLSKGTVDVGTKSAKQLVDGVTGVNEALVTLQEVVKPGLSVLASTVVTTAILETGTQSLDGKRKATEIAQNGGKCDMK
ncbi:MAG: hypothetical protein M1822_005058 [Bathelium mastoideum]|nr:MAG: hypothetical protein M1822_005058 [Bathelium mastoideum]